MNYNTLEKNTQKKNVHLNNITTQTVEELTLRLRIISFQGSPNCVLLINIPSLLPQSTNIQPYMVITSFSFRPLPLKYTSKHSNLDRTPYVCTVSLPFYIKQNQHIFLCAQLLSFNMFVRGIHKYVTAYSLICSCSPQPETLGPQASPSLVILYCLVSSPKLLSIF